MGRLKPILQCQWRAYWRRFRRSGTLNAGNQGILLLLSVLFFFKYVTALSIAAAELRSGKTARLERLLVIIFFIWLFPLITNARLSITTRALRRFPLTIKDLFLIKAGSLFIPPSAWLIVVASIALVYPISSAPYPLAGSLAALMFVVVSWLVGLTIAHLMSIAFWRKLVAGNPVVLLIAAAGFIYRGRGSLKDIQQFSVLPSALVVRAATGDRVWLVLSLLGILLVFFAWAALWSFRASLDSAAPSASQRNSEFKFFYGHVGALAAKDFRYYRRMFDPYLGLLASGISCFYFVIADVASPEVFWIFVILVFFPNASLAFNSFGLDSTPGLNRYRLFPLSGREIVLSKNQAYLAMMLVQLTPIFLFALWRLELASIVFGIIEAVLLAFAYLTWGNLFSIGHRFKMEFYRFSSGGSPVDALAGVIFGTIPGAIAIQLIVSGYWWVTLLLIVLYCGMYVASLMWSGRKFERHGVW